MAKRIVSVTKALEVALDKAIAEKNVNEVVRLSREIEAAKAGVANAGLSKGERFILWSLEQVKNDATCKANGWKGINVVFQQVPGTGFSVNEYLKMKLGYDRDGIIRLTADMVHKGLIGIIPSKKSVRIYRKEDTPVGGNPKTAADVDWAGLPADLQ